MGRLLEVCIRAKENCGPVAARPCTGSALTRCLSLPMRWRVSLWPCRVRDSVRAELGQTAVGRFPPSVQHLPPELRGEVGEGTLSMMVKEEERANTHPRDTQQMAPPGALSLHSCQDAGSGVLQRLPLAPRPARQAGCSPASQNQKPRLSFSAGWSSAFLPAFPSPPGQANRAAPSSAVPLSAWL